MTHFVNRDDDSALVDELLLFSKVSLIIVDRCGSLPSEVLMLPPVVVLRTSSAPFWSGRYQSSLSWTWQRTRPSYPVTTWRWP